jgi:hypothetical protein
LRQRSLEDSSRKEHGKWKVATLTDTNSKAQRLLGRSRSNRPASDARIGPLIIFSLSRLRRRRLAWRRWSRLRGAALATLTLQRGLALRIWLTLRILLIWLCVLLALLLVWSALLVLLPTLVGTRLRVLLSASVRLSGCCLLCGSVRLAGSIGLALPSRLLSLLTLPPGLLPLPAWCIRRALLLARRTLQAGLLLVAPLVDQLLAGTLRRKGLLHEGAIARRFLW